MLWVMGKIYFLFYLALSFFKYFMSQISMLSAGSPQEIFSFSFGGSSGNLLAAGSNAQVKLLLF